MPCVHPIPAWRTGNTGAIQIGIAPLAKKDAKQLAVPCATCIGCRTARAREWAVRCSLELQAHETACWTTLTYEEKYKPPTLQKKHLSGWLKRLRARVEPQKIRFFASGEYGERTQRPHYHAILYGLPADNREIQEAWPFGHTRTLNITPEAISYVAGYTSKKLGAPRMFPGEKVDPNTGEVYTYQEPFTEQSLGIGGQTKKFWRSWRDTAISNGLTIPVPRYLHEAWKANATEEEKEALQKEKDIRLNEKLLKGELKATAIQNTEANMLARHQLAAAKRQTL